MWQAAWDILCNTAIYVLIGFGLAGLLHVWMTGGRIIHWLSQRSTRSVFFATIVGAPLPLCSCGVLPAAITLRKKGASKGATLSFLISTPETSVTSILLTYSLLGVLMAVIRPIAAVITALAAGFMENLLDRSAPSEPTGDEPRETGEQAQEGESCCCCSAPSPQESTEPVTYRQGMHYAFVELFDDIYHWIVIGILAAAAIQAFIPTSVFQGFFSDPFTSMLLMLVIGVPLYICAESSTPIAAALIAQGMNPGAALVLLLAGPATNIGSVGALHRVLGRRTIIIYLVTIAVVSLLMGWLLHLLTSGIASPLAVRPIDEPLLPQWLKIAGAVAFLGLGVFTARRKRYWPRILGWLDARLPVPVTNRSVLIAAIVILVMLYVCSGFFAVQPGEVGIVKRFGAITRSNLEPGLHYALPYPIDVADRVPVRRVNRLVVGFASSTDSLAPAATDEGEAWTLLGDENIADVKAAVHWGAIEDQAIRFQYGVSDRTELVRGVTLGAVREVLGGESINRGFTSQRSTCEQQIENMIRERLESYDSGIRIDSFHFLDAHAPPEVHDAFRDVASALEDRSTSINLALAQEAKVVPLARGEGERAREVAAGYGATTRAQSKGKAQRFLDLLREYQRWPAVTRQRRYFEMLDTVLPGMRKYIDTTGAETGELEIWLIDPGLGTALPLQPGTDLR
jgi:HflK protein